KYPQLQVNFFARRSHELLLRHFAHQACELLPLPLATDVGAQLPLGHLQRALILANLQQFHNALLIRGQASHLANHLADELDALGEPPLGPGWAQSLLPLGDHMPLVEAYGQTRSHHVDQ
ncbi:hypothetical protein Vretifemale_13282, partial [Volvox reticuliferus]